MRTKKNEFFLIILIISILSFALALYYVKFRYDDVWFAQHVVNYNLVDWLQYRWGSWTSRMLPEALLWLLSPRSIFLWVGISTVLYGALIFYLYKYYRVIQPIHNLKLDSIALVTSALSVWLMSSDVTGEAIFWLTGSINYFWMGVAFLAALYTPYYIFIKDKLPQPLYIITSLVAVIMATFSNEQFGMCLIGLLAIFTAYYLWKHRKIDTNARFLIVTTITSIVLFGLALEAPGNAQRVKSETATWLPDMYTTTLSLRIESDIRWFMNMVINETGLLMVILWLVIGLLLRKNGHNRISLIMFGASGLLLLVKIAGLKVAGLALLPQLNLTNIVSFHALWHFSGSRTSWLPVLFWAVILMITLLAPILIYKKLLKVGILLSILLMFAALSLAALWLSPTMYASGYRVGYATSLLIGLTILLLLARLFEGFLTKHVVKTQNINQSKKTEIGF